MISTKLDSCFGSIRVCPITGKTEGSESAAGFTADQRSARIEACQGSGFIHRSLHADPPDGTQEKNWHIYITITSIRDNLTVS